MVTGMLWLIAMHCSSLTCMKVGDCGQCYFCPMHSLFSRFMMFSLTVDYLILV